LGKIVLKCKYRVRIEQFNRNYPVTREVTDQGAQLVISVIPHYLSHVDRWCHIRTQ